MKKRWNSLLALLMVVALCVPAFTCASSSSVAIYYVVTADGKPVNLRSACELDDSNIIGSIPYGTELMVYDFNYGGAWALVEFQGTMGYVMTRYLDVNNPYYNPYPPYTPVYPIYPDPAPTVTPTKNQVPAPARVLTIMDSNPLIILHPSSRQLLLDMSTCAGLLQNPPQCTISITPGICCR